LIGYLKKLLENKMQYDRNKIRGLTVEVRNDDVNGALRRFKKKVEESGLLQDLRDKEFYEKPTTARKRAKSSARARHLKNLEKQQLPKRTY
jgi:small subunit ribosomal protein S21